MTGRSTYSLIGHWRPSQEINRRAGPAFAPGRRLTLRLTLKHLLGRNRREVEPEASRSSEEKTLPARAQVGPPSKDPFAALVRRPFPRSMGGHPFGLLRLSHGSLSVLRGSSSVLRGSSLGSARGAPDLFRVPRLAQHPGEWPQAGPDATRPHRRGGRRTPERRKTLDRIGEDGRRRARQPVRPD